MKKLGEHLYEDIVWFGPFYGFKRKELIKKEVKGERINELLKSDNLIGEIWFDKQGRSEEFNRSGLTRVCIINSSDAAIKIKSIIYEEKGENCLCKVKFETYGKIQEFLDNEIMKLNYRLYPRTLTERKNNAVQKVKIITFDLIGGTEDRS